MMSVVGRFSSTRLLLESLVQDPVFGELERRESSFLLFRQSDNGQHGWVYLKDYGAIAFLGLTAARQRDILTHLHSLYQAEITEHLDSVEVLMGDSGKKSFGEIYIEHWTVDVIHLMMLNLSQSAALFHYQTLSEGLLDSTRRYTLQLEQKGKVSLKGKKLLRFIGTSLGIKNKISENLYVFESPRMAYDQAALSRLDLQLSDELDIKYRYSAIQEQLGIIQENLDLFKDISLHQHSSRLEWIIIWLILFEVIHVIIEQL